MGGKGWRLCLCAVLFASVVGVCGDLNDDVDDPTADSRSGNPIDIDLNESKAEDDDAVGFTESLANLGIHEHNDDDKRRKNFWPLDWNKEDQDLRNDPIYNIENSKGSLSPGPSVFPTEWNQKTDPVYKMDNRKEYLSPDLSLFPSEYNFKDDPIYVMENPKNSRLPEPSIFPPGYEFTKVDANNDGPAKYHGGFDGTDESFPVKDHFKVQLEPVEHDELVFHKDPTYDTVVLDNEYSYSSDNSSLRLGSAYFTPPHFFSKLIPKDEHLFLDKLSGAENIIKCLNEGEMHNFWAPGHPCMTCVCLATYGYLRPVCVSCQECLAPEPLRTTQKPPSPPQTTPPPPPEDVSCKPLPVNVPFQSPLDPCKVCVCSESRNQWGRVDVRIQCQRNKECVLPTTPRTQVSTPVPLPVCEKLPPNVPFPHPHDACKTCQCTVTRTRYGHVETKINCYPSPECQPTTSTQTPDMTDLPPLEFCDRYPENALFPHPYDQCQDCKCTVQRGLYKDRKTITCYVKPSCLPETTVEPVTVTPEPTHLCGRYPDDVIFQDPADHCKLCKCHRDPNNGFKEVITCFLKAECVLTPTTEYPVPRDICQKYPVNTPFDDPNDRCRACRCTDGSTAPGFGLQNALPPSQLQILCQIKPECLPPPTTERPLPPPTTENSVPHDTCGKYPINTPFDDPNDQCRTCTCSYISNPAPSTGLQNMLPRLQILCHVKPECLSPPPPPPTTEYPDNDVCGRYPINTPFDDPNNQCRTCSCSYVGSAAPSAGLQNALPQLQILCEMKPECLHPPPTEHPDYDVCGKYPVGTPFDDPNDQCQTCICTQIGSAPPAFGALQNSYYTTTRPPQVQIQCQIKPECSPTERPELTTICDGHEVDVPFEDPRDSCRSCVCYWGSSGSAPGQGLMNALPIKLYKCVLKPECLPTPITEKPEAHSFCQNYPVDVPFTDPRDPCFSCVCYWGFPGAVLGGAPSDVFGHAAPSRVKLVKCLLKPECHRPTSEPITRAPLPDVTCKPLPSGKPFQSPLNPCQICTCTETVDVYGRPDVVFKCQQNPQCVVPQDVTTLPPDTSPVPLPACAQFPTNVEFPHPNDQCKLCKCTVQRTPWGKLEQLIYCYASPECAIKTTTVAPWPPAPPGPLPGPAPHESCSPYVPNKPFQHPWDECQVCVCKEAISSDRINIEVNCYTKPSCCYEPLYDIPGLPDSGSIDGKLLIDGSGSSSINSGSGGSYQWKYEKDTGIGTGAAIANINGQIGGEVMYSSSGNLIGSVDSNLNIPFGSQIYDQNAYNIEEITNQQKHWYDENWTSAQGERQRDFKENIIRPSDNIMGYANGNYAGAVGGKIISESENNVIGNIESSGGHWIVNADGNMIRGTSENAYGSSARNLYGTYNGNLYRPAGENFKSSISANGNQNMYGSNLENLLLKPVQGKEQGLWRQTYGYKLKPEAALEFKVEGDASLNGLSSNVASTIVQNLQSGKMRTKSARPRDNTSEDYD